jgi:hypothetical protein
MALTNPGELTPMQEKAIIALLNEGTVAAAARAAGCGERTLHKWLYEHAAFRAEYRRHRREAFSHAIALAQRLSPMAMTTLAKIAADTSAPFAARVAASTAILKFGRESMELDDLAERITRLENTTADRIVADSPAREVTSDEQDPQQADQA